jgi:flavin-dependent dehydrogenase
LAKEEKYQAIIIGGGLAGLSLAILLAHEKRSVLLVEKSDYPRHKVCGEYISLESWDFVERLGIPISKMNLPKMDTLKISSESGVELTSELDLGGFGISRYVLEDLLYKKAIELGVNVMVRTKYVSYEKQNNSFQVETSAGSFMSEVLCGAFGKYAPKQFYKKNEEKHNWVGVKYHIHYEHPSNEIVLHNFEGGYCGMSKIEENKSCLCYIVQQKMLTQSGSDIAKMETEILRKNPNLEKIFSQAKFLYDKPQVISNVTFDVKKPVHDGVFYLGDSAGTIAPLSGNGMSNAFRSANLLNKSLSLFFQEEKNFTETLRTYQQDWDAAFSGRIKLGRTLQQFFCKKNLNAASIRILNYAKPIHKFIIRKTHGQPF